MASLAIRPVMTKADRRAFVELPYRLYARDPNWVPPLRAEVHALITPDKNPWFEHGRAQLFLAERGGDVVGRISAHIDALALAAPVEQGMGPGTGNWGMLEAADQGVAHALLTTAESWLRGEGMTRALGPLSLSIWDEPGLLTFGHDHPPTVMMGHNAATYQGWVESAGHGPVKKLTTSVINIVSPFPDIVNRIIASGEKSSRIHIRNVDKRKFDTEAALILNILNDAWSDNWGFVPITDSEIAHVGKKLKPLVFENLIRIAEYDGRPVAFMMVFPDMNEVLHGLGGSLLPFGWAKLLWWLRAPKVRTMRVPLMGVIKELQSSRVASQLAFMMTDYIRRDAVAKYGATRGEFGWVLEDNQGMNAVSDALLATMNKTYTVYSKPL